MTATTKAVLCAAGQWTAVSTAKAKVLASLRSSGAIYLKTGAAAPTVAPTTEDNASAGFDFLTITADRPASFTFSDTTTNVYAYPRGDSAKTIETVTE